jgi:hypothetical protein
MAEPGIPLQCKFTLGSVRESRNPRASISGRLDGEDGIERFAEAWQLVHSGVSEVNAVSADGGGVAAAGLVDHDLGVVGAIHLPSGGTAGELGDGDAPAEVAKLKQRPGNEPQSASGRPGCPERSSTGAETPLRYAGGDGQNRRSCRSGDSR